MKMLKKTFTLLFLGIIGYLVIFAFNAYLARHLNAELYGDFSVALNVLKIVASLILFGTDASANRFVSSYLGNKDNRNLQAYFSWNFRIVATAIIFRILMLALIYLILSIAHITGAIDIEIHLMIKFIWIAPIASVSLLLASFLLCSKKYNTSYIMTCFAKNIFMLAYLAVALNLFDTILRTTDLFIMVTLSYLAMLVVELIIIRVCCPQVFINELVKPNPSIKLKQTHWFNVSKNLVLNNIIYIILSTADLLIVESIVPGESDVALLSIIITICSILLIVPQSIYKIIKPNISIAIEKNNFENLQKVIVRCNKVAILASISLLLFINIFPKELVGLFGSYFSPEIKTPLLIFSLGYFSFTLSKPCALILAFSGHEKKLVSQSMLELGMLILFGLILTYYFGITGMATATTISLYYRALAGYVSVMKNFSELRPWAIR